MTGQLGTEKLREELGGGLPGNQDRTDVVSVSQKTPVSGGDRRQCVAFWA